MGGRYVLSLFLSAPPWLFELPVLGKKKANVRIRYRVPTHQVSSPMISLTGAGLTVPVRSVWLALAERPNLFLPSNRITNTTFARLIVPANLNRRLCSNWKEPAGMLALNVPIRRVTFSVVGEIPLLVGLRVKVPLSLNSSSLPPGPCRILDRTGNAAQAPRTSVRSAR